MTNNSNYLSNWHFCAKNCPNNDNIVQKQEYNVLKLVKLEM